MSLSPVDKVVLGIVLVYFASAISWLGIALYLAYTKMYLMLKHMKNSPAVMIRVFLLQAGVWGRMHVFGLIMGLMVMPGLSIRKGVVSAEDIKNFPSGLKRQLVIMQWVCWGLLLLMLGLFVVIKIGFV